MNTELKIFNKTDKTPEVIFDYNKNTISITGICVPEDPKSFFDPIIEEVEHYKKLKSEVCFEVYLEYFNTGASKYLLNLFLQTSKYENNFQKAEVNWYIEKDDDELQEAGEVFEEISKLKFNYKEIDGHNN